MPLRRFTRQFFFQIMVLLLGLAAVVAGAKAQGAIGDTTTTPIAGVPHDYITGLNEIVNPANGALSIRIGQPVPHERGQNWPAYAFVYDSNGFYSLQPGWTTNTNGTPTTFLTQLQFGALSATAAPNSVSYILNYLSDCVPNGQTCLLFQCTERTGYVYGDPDGGQHGLGIQYAIPTTHVTSNDCDHFSVHNYYLGGDDRFKASMDQNTYVVTVTDLHGNNPVVEDANGNYHNTTNRTASVPARSTLQTETINQSTAALNITSNSKSTYCNLTSISKFAATSIVTKSVTLPNGEQYTFQYDAVFGLINKITYPTGATVTYTWSVIPDSQGVRYSTLVLNSAGGNCSLHYDWFAITKRVVSYDGTTNAQEQDFSYNTIWPSPQSYQWTTKTTTVTTKDLLRGTNFNAVYTYSPMLPPAESDYPLADLGYVPVEKTVQYYDTNGALLKTVAKVWTTMSNLSAECETLPNGQTSGKFYVYQPYAPFVVNHTPFNSDAYTTNLPTDVTEYDYGQISTACVQPSVLPIRETVTAYQVFPNSPISVLNSIQDRPSSVKVYGVVAGTRTLLKETDYVYDGSTPSPVSPVPYGHDETNFGSGSAPRGNPTTITRKCFVGATSCTNSVATYTYDTTGQVLSVKDANLNTTTYSYADSYTSDDGSPSANTNAFVTKITKPVTNGVSHITQFQYGFNDGKLRLVTDENNLQTKYCYWAPNGCSGTTFDPFVRLTEIDRPDGGKTNETYNDAGNSPSVTTSNTINSSQTVVSTTVSDGMGHAKQSQLTSDPQGTVFTDTTYDGLGQVWKQSNPYRTGTDPTTTAGTTIFVYDSLGRKLTATYPDNSVLTSAYCNQATLVTDPTRRWRRSISDALGHLIEVDEPNSSTASVSACVSGGDSTSIWKTTYGYDGLGNLLSVLQNGSHARSFTYDSLSRLLTSTNPEVGTLTYVYDPNSNVLTKKDARNITITYVYDALNREKTASYSNGDPTVSTNYDESNCLGLSPCQNIGHRTSGTDASGSGAWSFQADKTHLRSVHVNQRTTVSTPSNITKSFTYYMDLAGNVSSIVYPSGRTVNYNFDNAGRPSKATDASTGIVYAAAPAIPLTGCPTAYVCYTPQGSIYSMSLGQTTGFTGLNINETFNNRLQPNEIKVSSTGGNAMDLSYNFIDPATLKNAGHVYGMVNNLDSTRSQTFTYDQLNRITGAQTNLGYASSPSHCWSEVFGLDAWANLQSIAATTNSAYTGCSQESGFAQTANAFNHLPSFGYDASGNTTGDGIHNYQWNAESQFTWTYNVAYHYDGDGRRVSKVGQYAASKLYWYGSGGEILSETSPAGYLINDYIFFGGKRIAAAPNDLNLNGGFEQGLANWAVAGPGTATSINNPANAHSGNNYAEVTTPSGYTTTTLTTTQPISGQIGETVTFTGWVYHESDSTGYTRWWVNVQGSNGNVDGDSTTSATLNTWIYQSASAVIPSFLEGPYIATVYAQVASDSTAASARFDDVTLNGNLTLFAEDMLGTSRVVTDGSGIVCYDGDFYPYGGERAYTNTCDPTYKFEGKERDTETGNDDFGARYYSNRFGRWLSADWSAVPEPIPYADLANPQTLNLYSMVSDDPESFADLDGHCHLGSHSWGACPWFSEDDQHQQAHQQPNAAGRCGFWCKLFGGGRPSGSSGGSTAGGGISGAGAIPFPLLSRVIPAAGGATAGAGAVVVGAALVVTGEIADYNRTKGQEQLDAIESEVAVENILLAQNTSQQTKVVVGLLGTAAEHLVKLGGSSPNDPDRDKWKAEVKAALNRATRVANRLPGAARDKFLEIVREYSGQLRQY